ncbi:kinase-like domain-containing protein, partial [Mycena leptocephala]
QRLDKLLQDKASYTRFLACRDTSAQRLLDLLQDVGRRLFKALWRLSGISQLHPKCFTLPDLQRGKHVAGGSFSDVYKGLLRGEDVAIKKMRVFGEANVDTVLKDFGQEAIIWRQLSHPSLLPFIGLYYFDEGLCLVSPWMENGDIGTFLTRKECDTKHRLSLVSGSTLKPDYTPIHVPQILDVALGLRHLHKKQVVHGDLKPVCRRILASKIFTSSRSRRPISS